MANGDEPDPLRTLVAAIIGGCVILCVIILTCYWADYPAGFWGN